MTVRFTTGPATSRDSRGVPYVTLAHSGLKEEGATIDWWGNAESVWAAYWTELSNYLERNSAVTVEWRSPPTLEEYEGRYWVRSRLSVTERADSADFKTLMRERVL